MLPCLIFEDEHLLVVNKPAGINTHAPGPDAGEGIYDWLRHREPRWATLAIIHRLDKETSGLLLLSKTRLANRSLTDQFEQRTVRKKYLLVSDRPGPRGDITVKSSMTRAGEKHVSRPWRAGVDLAETIFRPLTATSTDLLQKLPAGISGHFVEAEPRTGRTHQIRVHAADQGFPILGDVLYGGASAPRVYLHAAELIVKHPSTGEEMAFGAPLDFATDPRLLLRNALLDPKLTTACRVIHGASDGWPGWYVERFGDFLLSQSEQPVSQAQLTELRRLMASLSARGASHKVVARPGFRGPESESSCKHILGEPAPARFSIREYGLAFEINISGSSSTGLFLDQRDNRRRCLTGHIAADFQLFADFGSSGSHPELLNTFAYTCGFSICAAKAGAHATSLDLSKSHLEWGRRNFALNELDPAVHEFIHGDVFDWLRRFERKQRRFDAVLLDPPTFSRSKDSGIFRAERDCARLIETALRVLTPRGTLFVSTNSADWRPESFRAAVEEAVKSAKRNVMRRHYIPQPADFPISRSEPAYLKTLWLQVG